MHARDNSHTYASGSYVSYTYVCIIWSQRDIHVSCEHFKPAKDRNKKVVHTF